MHINHEAITHHHQSARIGSVEKRSHDATSYRPPTRIPSQRYTARVSTHASSCSWVSTSICTDLGVNPRRTAQRSAVAPRSRWQSSTCRRAAAAQCLTLHSPLSTHQSTVAWPAATSCTPHGTRIVSHAMVPRCGYAAESDACVHEWRRKSHSQCLLAMLPQYMPEMPIELSVNGAKVPRSGSRHSDSYTGSIFA